MFYIPTRSAYLCNVFVYKFEVPTFNEIKAKALANTSQYVVLLPLYFTTPSLTRLTARRGRMQLQRYTLFFKFDSKNWIIFDFTLILLKWDGVMVKMHTEPNAWPRVQLEGHDEAVYNLSGQRSSKPQKGINIIDGKKVVVKWKRIF